jgi:DNA-binding NarL/FixJ family response regulator
MKKTEFRNELDSLTPREIQIIKLSFLGNKIIAGELGVCEQTVKNQLNSASRKLGTITRTETLLRFLQLLPPEKALDYLNSQEFINGQGPS